MFVSGVVWMVTSIIFAYLNCYPRWMVDAPHTVLSSAMVGALAFRTLTSIFPLTQMYLIAQHPTKCYPTFLRFSSNARNRSSHRDSMLQSTLWHTRLYLSHTHLLHHILSILRQKPSLAVQTTQPKMVRRGIAYTWAYYRSAIGDLHYG